MKGRTVPVIGPICLKSHSAAPAQHAVPAKAGGSVEKILYFLSENQPTNPTKKQSDACTPCACVRQAIERRESQ
jgi:hypothetical protein